MTDKQTIGGAQPVSLSFTISDPEFPVWVWALVITIVILLPLLVMVGVIASGKPTSMAMGISGIIVGSTLIIVGITSMIRKAFIVGTMILIPGIYILVLSSYLVHLARKEAFEADEKEPFEEEPKVEGCAL